MSIRTPPISVSKRTRPNGSRRSPQRGVDTGAFCGGRLEPSHLTRVFLFRGRICGRRCFLSHVTLCITLVIFNRLPLCFSLYRSDARCGTSLRKHRTYRNKSEPCRAFSLPNRLVRTTFRIYGGNSEGVHRCAEHSCHAIESVRPLWVEHETASHLNRGLNGRSSFICINSV